MPLPFLLYGAGIIAYGLIGSAVGYGIGSAINYIKVWSFKKKEIYLSILGPIASGKTTIHNFLRKTKYSGATIGAHSVQEIKIKNDETKQTITIRKGLDISGSEIVIKANYEDEIKKSDIIFFVVDSTKLLKEDNYKKNERGRLNFIIKKNNEKNEPAAIIVIMSYVDQLQSIYGDAKGKAWDTIADIASEGKINSPFFANLMDQNDLKKLKNKLFE